MVRTLNTLRSILGGAAALAIAFGLLAVCTAYAAP